MALKWHELTSGREYIISHDKNIHKNKIYKGIFIGSHESRGSRLIPIEKRRYGEKYETVISWYSLFSINDETKFFFEDDIYYDLEKIRDTAENARRQMEQRSLNIILKRIVNEEFQW
uniref:Uncharacterized protein n=1 Tax=viral metagenome TaxID=1070528 RepID=A0A6C0D1P8_9ZZZZ